MQAAVEVRRALHGQLAGQLVMKSQPALPSGLQSSRECCPAMFPENLAQWSNTSASDTERKQIQKEPRGFWQHSKRIGSLAPGPQVQAVSRSVTGVRRMHRTSRPALRNSACKQNKIFVTRRTQGAVQRGTSPPV